LSDNSKEVDAPSFDCSNNFPVGLLAFVLEPAPKLASLPENILLQETGSSSADLLNQPDCLGPSPRPHLKGAARGP